MSTLRTHAGQTALQFGRRLRDVRPPRDQEINLLTQDARIKRNGLVVHARSPYVGIERIGPSDDANVNEPLALVAQDVSHYCFVIMHEGRELVAPTVGSLVVKTKSCLFQPFNQLQNGLRRFNTAYGLWS